MAGAGSTQAKNVFLNVIIWFVQFYGVNYGIFFTNYITYMKMFKVASFFCVFIYY